VPSASRRASPDVAPHSCSTDCRPVVTPQVATVPLLPDVPGSKPTDSHPDVKTLSDFSKLHTTFYESIIVIVEYILSGQRCDGYGC
jgi:hypothetical protein